MNHLDIIENRIKEIIENSARVFPWTDQYSSLLRSLYLSLQAFILDSHFSSEDFPTQFHVYMNPEETRLWKKQPDWDRSLVSAFHETFQEFGLKTEKDFFIALTARHSLHPGEILIQKDEKTHEPGKTGSITAYHASSSPKGESKRRTTPYLLVNNNEIILLEKNVINIGRRSTNEVIINDLRISRLHAQIRKSKNGLMIFDVGSTGGTFINGERIANHQLRSGDVISLAGYTMIYTDENEESQEIKREKTAEIPVFRGSE